VGASRLLKDWDWSTLARPTVIPSRNAAMKQKNMEVLAAGGAALLIVAGVAACSSPSTPSTVTLVASTKTVAEGSPLTLNGALSARKAVLAATLQMGTNGVFASVGQQTATDAGGAYEFSYTPMVAGPITLRVEIVNGGKLIDSLPVTVASLQLLDLSLTVKGSSEVDVAKTVLLTGKLSPAVSGSKVSIEYSSSGDAFAASTTEAQVGADGTFSALLAEPVGVSGALDVRAHVLATSTSSDSVSPTVHVYFADYKSLGMQYLKCVGPGNHAIDLYDAAVDSFNRSAISFRKFALTELAVGTSDRAQAVCLRSGTWPPSVAARVSDLATQDDVTADEEITAGRTHSNAAYDAVFDAAYTSAQNKASADAAAIRARLGLGVRPPD
jgi:hypothetical protein